MNLCLLDVSRAKSLGLDVGNYLEKKKNPTKTKILEIHISSTSNVLEN